MMQDTHRLKRNERAQSTNGLRAPRAPPGARRSKVQVVKVCLCSVLLLAGLASLAGPALWTVPPKPGFGAAPILTPKNFGALLKYLALDIDHDQVEFLGTETPGLEPPQIDHQLPGDGHHGLFLQPPVSAPQDFLPFLNRLILGLKEDQAPGRLHSDAPNGWYSHF